MLARGPPPAPPFGRFEKYPEKEMPFGLISTANRVDLKKKKTIT